MARSVLTLVAENQRADITRAARNQILERLTAEVRALDVEAVNALLKNPSSSATSVQLLWRAVRDLIDPDIAYEYYRAMILESHTDAFTDDEVDTAINKLELYGMEQIWRTCLQSKDFPVSSPVSLSASDIMGLVLGKLFQKNVIDQAKFTELNTFLQNNSLELQKGGSVTIELASHLQLTVRFNTDQHRRIKSFSFRLEVIDHEDTFAAKFAPEVEEKRDQVRQKLITDLANTDLEVIFQQIQQMPKAISVLTTQGIGLSDLSWLRSKRASLLKNFTPEQIHQAFDKSDKWTITTQENALNVQPSDSNTGFYLHFTPMEESSDQQRFNCQILLTAEKGDELKSTAGDNISHALTEQMRILLQRREKKISLATLRELFSSGKLRDQDLKIKVAHFGDGLEDMLTAELMSLIPSELKDKMTQLSQQQIFDLTGDGQLVTGAAQYTVHEIKFEDDSSQRVLLTCQDQLSPEPDPVTGQINYLIEYSIIPGQKIPAPQNE